MKLTRTLLTAAVASALALSLAACNNSGNPSQPAGEQTPEAAQPAAPNTNNGATGNNQAIMPPPAQSTAPAMAGSSAMAGNAATNWFGGPIYSGDPALAATAALVKAGGGADDFKFSTALVSMLGQKTVDAEVAKLNKQYGKDKVDGFLKGMTFAINDGLKRATEVGVTLPAPADVSGTDLAKALVQAGTAPDGTFWAGYLFDHAISHKLHNQVMADIDAKFSHEADGNTHKILNQAMYDVAQALGMKDVKLAPFH